MHNRALHDSLAAFVQEAAWQLAEEVSGGAEVPFELDATPTRSAPLYCYRPLTGRFIAQRSTMLSRLPTYASCALSVVIPPVEGLVIESDEVALGDGLSLARATTLADAPAGLPADPHATVAILALATEKANALELAGRR